MAIRADLRQSIPSRPPRPRRLWTPLAAAALALVGAASATTLADRWSAGTSVPEPRTEVAAARFGNEIGVVGGFLADGTSSARADAYSPTRNAWRPLPRYPLAVNHAAAAAWRGRLIVIGGYVAQGMGTARGFELVGGRWRGLPPMPEWRAAAGAAVVGNRLYVVGGVAPGRARADGRSCSTSARGAGAASSAPSRASTSP